MAGQGVAVTTGFTNNEDDAVDKDYTQPTVAQALIDIPTERRYNGKMIFSEDVAERGLYLMNAAKTGFDKFEAGGGSPLDSSTGVISFEGFTAFTATTFDIGEIKAQFIDYSDPANPIIAPIVIRAAETGITDPLIATANITYVLMNSAGVLEYLGTEPTALDLVDKAFVGQIGHPDRVNITSAISVTSNIQNPASQLRELFAGLGPVVQSGLTFNPSATLMKFSLAAGTVVDLGLGANGNEPYSTVSNTKNYAAVDPVPSFLYVASDGSNAAATVVDPDNYDPNGDILNLVVVPNNKFTVQYIVIFKGGFINIQYGQSIYDSLDNAMNAVIRGEEYTFADVISQSALVRTALILKKGLTGNLIDAVVAGTAHFHNFGKFGIESGSSGHSGVAGTTFQVVYGNSEIPQIITNSTLGALTIQRGSALDTDAVFGVRNGAGANVYELTGEGFIKSGSTFEHFVNGIKAFEIDASQNTTFYGNIELPVFTGKIGEAGAALFNFIYFGSDNAIHHKGDAFYLDTAGGADYWFRRNAVTANVYKFRNDATLSGSSGSQSFFLTANANASGQTGTAEFNTFMADIITAGRTSTGEANHLRLQTNGADVFKVGINGIVTLKEQALPVLGEVAGYGRLIANSGDSKLYWRDDSGADYDLTSGGGNVTKVGTPLINEVAVWSGDGTLGRSTAFKYSTSSEKLSLTGIADSNLTVEITTDVLPKVIIANNAATAGAHAGMFIQTNVGDPYILLGGVPLTSFAYVLGVDNSDSNTLKLKYSTSILTNPSSAGGDLLTITTTGYLSLPVVRLGLFAATPVVQPSHIIDADGSLADITTKFNTLLAQMAALGIQAAS